MNESYAYLTCKCGAKFQILKIEIIIDENENEIEIIDLDELETAKAFSNHKC